MKIDPGIANWWSGIFNTASEFVDYAIVIHPSHIISTIASWSSGLWLQFHVHVGNLTYHFPKKEDLMLAIYDLFQDEMSAIIPKSCENFPGLFELDEQIKSFYKLQQRFLFFYLDLLEIERSFESIAKRHFTHIENQITAIKAGLKYNVTSGYLDEEKEEQDYDLLAQQIWFTAVFWPRQVRVRGIEDNPENMRIVLWHQIKPYLTEAGESQVNTILVNTNIQHTIQQS